MNHIIDIISPLLFAVFLIVSIPVMFYMDNTWWEGVEAKRAEAWNMDDEDEPIGPGHYTFKN